MANFSVSLEKEDGSKVCVKVMAHTGEEAVEIIEPFLADDVKVVDVNWEQF